MRFLEGGSFAMGSDDHYPEEAPVRTVDVDPFWIDTTPVTNAEFGRFVEDSGYVTRAERVPDPADYPGLDPADAKPGSIVFVRPRRGAGPVGPQHWWKFVLGADWRKPYGPTHPARALDSHPVVHIALPDALAYAQWAGKSLPSEAEWEFAARGGLSGRSYAWGDELAPDGRQMANYWMRGFPYKIGTRRNAVLTTPVGRFPENGFGLSDMIGNVWEWTGDDYRDQRPNNPCCSSHAEGKHSAQARKVLKGGSHLCAPEYCRRYRPAARHAQPADSGTTHIGFRCIIRAA
ncbi:MAG: formylglycine-generating enzyme family protein [Parasphingopyxis sp.]|uniref:formylglycine-generating enzyme family protein n=1 Tax=Parasphingopyxis sp. TaxID=1920299 RepID=UPI0032EF1062